MGARCSEPLCGTDKKHVVPTAPIESETLVARHRRVVHTRQPFTDFYESLSVLHRGKFSVIYRAKRKNQNHWSAVRQVRQADTDVDHWRKVIAVMERCDHPHIIRLYETFESTENLSSVIELCLGQSLLDIGNVDKSLLTEGTVAALTRQMLSAIGHLHTQEVGHGLLLPECFIFTKKLMKGTILADLCLKLVDFGLVRTLTDSSDQTGEIGEKPAKKRADASRQRRSAVHQILTAKGVKCAAPEQLGSSAELICTAECDVWSVGAIAFFLLSARWPTPPKEGETACALEPSGTWYYVSYSGKSFVTQCLQLDPQRRGSANALLNMQWMSMAREAFEASEEAKRSVGNANRRSILAAPLVSASAIVEGFQKMAKMNDLERASVTAVAHHLPEDRIAHLRTVFQKLDTNGDGTLTVDEISKGLGSAADGKILGEIAAILKAIDTDGNGSIDYTEFIAATYACRQNLRDEICDAAFRMFDQDGSGTVTTEEVKTFLYGENTTTSRSTTTGKGSPASELSSLLAGVDQDGDGEMDLEEFKIMIRGGESMESMRRKARGSCEARASCTEERKAPGFGGIEEEPEGYQEKDDTAELLEAAPPRAAKPKKKSIASKLRSTLSKTFSSTDSLGNKVGRNSSIKKGFQKLRKSLSGKLTGKTTKSDKVEKSESTEKVEKPTGAKRPSIVQRLSRALTGEADKTKEEENTLVTTSQDKENNDKVNRNSRQSQDRSPRRSQDSSGSAFDSLLEADTTFCPSQGRSQVDEYNKARASRLSGESGSPRSRRNSDDGREADPGKKLQVMRAMLPQKKKNKDSKGGAKVF